MIIRRGPGPCIAGVIDMRRRDRKLEEGYVLEEGTPPSSVDLAYKYEDNFIYNKS